MPTYSCSIALKPVRLWMHGAEVAGVIRRRYVSACAQIGRGYDSEKRYLDNKMHAINRNSYIPTLRQIAQVNTVKEGLLLNVIEHQVLTAMIYQLYE